MTVTTAAAVVVLTLGGAGAARATDLSTGSIFVRAGESVFCTATNVGKTPITVTVDVIDSLESSLNGPSTCALGPGAICLQEIPQTPGLERFMFCRVTSTGAKVRGLIMGSTSGALSEAR